MDNKRLTKSFLVSIVLTLFLMAIFIYFVCGSEKSSLEKSINRAFDNSYKTCSEKLIGNMNLFGVLFTFLVIFIIIYYKDSKILKFLYSKTTYFRTNKHKKRFPKFIRNFINSFFWSSIIIAIILTIFINGFLEEITIKSYIFILLFLSLLYSFFYAFAQFLKDYSTKKKRKKKNKVKLLN